MRKEHLFLGVLLAGAAGAGLLAVELAVGRRGDVDTRAVAPVIDVWYGYDQHFGRLGNPQRWVNILGDVFAVNGIAALGYRLNGGAEQPLSVGPNLTRLARPGDFNVELPLAALRDGPNALILIARDRAGNQSRAEVRVHYSAGRQWPLPYRIDWSEAGAINDVAQVVDGRWQLTGAGVRTLTTAYDRVIAVGDRRWQDYEVSVPVTFHAFAGPRPEAPFYGVTHAAVALRWPGHAPDRHQPYVKWHPLGATSELRLSTDLRSCAWRILMGPSRAVEQAVGGALALGVPYQLKTQVRSLPDGRSRYRVKRWRADAPEPEGWDVEALKGPPDDLPAGSALLIAHHTDVTFGDVTVTALPAAPASD